MAQNGNSYYEACMGAFWGNVLKKELEYLTAALGSSKEILSAGCGPAIIESGLAERGHRLTCIDTSRDMLANMSGCHRTEVMPAEAMTFPADSFDAAIYCVSLQFMADYIRAIGEGARVLRDGGQVIIMLLNPKSKFFKDKVADKTSYIAAVRHTDIAAIESCVAALFDVSGEYIIGIDGERIYETSSPDEAAIYVLKGRKK